MDRQTVGAMDTIMMSEQLVQSKKRRRRRITPTESNKISLSPKLSTEWLRLMVILSSVSLFLTLQSSFAWVPSRVSRPSSLSGSLATTKFSRRTSTCATLPSNEATTTTKKSPLPPPIASTRKKRRSPPKWRNVTNGQGEPTNFKTRRNNSKRRSVPKQIPKLSEVLDGAVEVEEAFEKHRVAPNNRTVKRSMGNQQTTNLPGDASTVEEPSEPTESEAWKAGYYTSIKTQQKIKRAALANWSSSSSSRPMDRAVRVLQTFHNTPPEKCNAANLVCALTLSAKVADGPLTEEFRQLLFQTTDVLADMLDMNLLSARQLCNVIWAIAKFYIRDEQILPADNAETALSSEDAIGSAETWDLRSIEENTPAQRLDRVTEHIAKLLALKLQGDRYTAKEGELCMASWAYGILKPRRRPPGWRHRPQVASTGRKALPTSEKLDVVKFESWTALNTDDDEDCDELDPPSAINDLFDAIALAMTEPESNGTYLLDSIRIRSCQWRELANMAWAFASHGRSCSIASQNLLLDIAREASERLREHGPEDEHVLSRDIAQIIWSLGTLQSDKYRLAEGLIEVVDSLIVFARLDKQGESVSRPFGDWSCADLVQVILSLAHARMDELDLLRPLYEEASRRIDNGSKFSLHTEDHARKSFRAWELSILLWAQARLHLKAPQGAVFERFAAMAAVSIFRSARRHESLTNVGIGAQEQANLVWSLTVLEEYSEDEVVSLISRIFDEAAEACDCDGLIHLEHAHQFWQALFLLEEESPECVKDVPRWFYDYLQDKWAVEKARAKISSARHKSLSNALNLMGIQHVNEHDEDIDVAIILKPQASWTHETKEDGDDEEGSVNLAVEFDGPNHFTRQRDPVDLSVKPPPPRALGHTILKYRLLKKQGWTVVRVPYYEFDKIPFWASMERQRYLQRLLKTHGRLRFSETDASEYKAPVPNRQSRFD